MRSSFLPLGAVTVSLALVAASASAQTDEKEGPCERKRDIGLRWLAEGKLKPAMDALEKSYAECGDGHGLLAAIGRGYAMQGQLDKAADSYLRELGTTAPTANAVFDLVELGARIPQKKRQAFFDMGATNKTPIHLHRGAVTTWSTEVICRGAPVLTQRQAFEYHDRVFRYELECPKGTFITRYVKLTEVPYQKNLQAQRLTALERLLDPKGTGDHGKGRALELRERLSQPVSSNYGQFWLLGGVGDLARQLEVNRLLVKEDPDDAAAIQTLATLQITFGDYAGAVKTARAANPKTAVMRGGVGGAVSGIYSKECYALRRMGKLGEALAACKRSLSLGSRINGPSFMGEVLFVQGKNAEALAQFQASTKASFDNDIAHLLTAVLLQEMGRPEAEVRSEWSYAQHYPRHLGTKMTDKRSHAEWMALIDAYRDRTDAHTLAQAGHYYLDLDLPELSKASFAASEKMNPAPARAVRIEHLAESDPKAAAAQAEALLEKDRDYDLLVAAADAWVRAGDKDRGLMLVEEAFIKHGGWDRAWHVQEDACAPLNMRECYDKIERLKKANGGK